MSKKHPRLRDDILKRYSGSYVLEVDNKILIKSNVDMNLPCFCLYGLKVEDFPTPNSEGWTKLSREIDSRYFQSFADNMSLAQVAALPTHKKPAVVAIKNVGDFIGRVKSKLASLGISEEQIVVKYIGYREFSDVDVIPVDFGCYRPEELFVKRSEFAYQQKIRIMINTDDPIIIKKLDAPIEIGNLSDIAQLTEGYFDGGILVEARFNVFAVE